MVKNLPANAGDTGSIVEWGRSPGEGNGNPLQVFLSGKSHGQRRLAGYSPRGHKSVRHNLVTKTNSHLVCSKLNTKTTSHSQMTQTHVFILLCLVHFMVNSSLWLVFFPYLTVFQSAMNSLFSLYPNPLLHFM